jgi:hypothetical protein
MLLHLSFREKKTIISLYSINWLVFVTETECVYCAVWTGSLYVIQLNFTSSWFSSVSIIPPLLHLIHSSTTNAVECFSPSTSVCPVSIIAPIAPMLETDSPIHYQRCMILAIYRAVKRNICYFPPREIGSWTELGPAQSTFLVFLFPFRHIPDHYI